MMENFRVKDWPPGSRFGNKIHYFQGDTWVALWWRDMARKSHRKIRKLSLFSPVSSSGGGLPGCPELEKVQGIRYFRELSAAAFVEAACPLTTSDSRALRNVRVKN